MYTQQEIRLNSRERLVFTVRKGVRGYDQMVNPGHEDSGTGISCR
jgi:hypothetical protein